MNNVRLAVDVDSGDFGPQVILSGILEARAAIEQPFNVCMCGKRDRIRSTIREIGAEDQLDDAEIVDSDEIIDPGERRASAWKKHTGAAVVRCITLQKEGAVDASISAGDTAILMGAALFILGRSEGARRPVLAAFLPTVKKKPVLLLDVGANLNCRAEHLISFAILGERYISRFRGMPSPVVTLLNIGKEAVKGTREIAEAALQLQEICPGYGGFIEGHDILSGDADVVVCDGFSGNVLLKACESFHRLAGSILGDAAVQKDDYKRKMKILDPDNYGAVPFLGINGTVLKAHGGSSSHAIANAIAAAITVVNRRAVQ